MIDSEQVTFSTYPLYKYVIWTTYQPYTSPQEQTRVLLSRVKFSVFLFQPVSDL